MEKRPSVALISQHKRTKKRYSNEILGTNPQPLNDNSFATERLANAAKREQRGHRGGNSRGTTEGRGAFKNNSVRFRSSSPNPIAPQQSKPVFGQQRYGPKPGEKAFVIPKKPGSPHPRSKLSQSIAISVDNDHVSKIKNILDRNGLTNYPQWPMAQPGDPKQNNAVKDFWQSTKGYREKVRKVLMNAGLIDDPDKPKKLSEAIDFKGTCEEMCPRFEQITRIMERDVKNLEKEPAHDGSLWPAPSRMIKAYGRSSAGQDAPLPDDIRTPGALRKTLDYLLQEVLGGRDNLPAVHNFLWDRTRSIRRDFTFQQASLSSSDYKDEVYCLETIAKFHVVALHHMSNAANTSDDFSEHQEVEQLGRTLLSLIHTYEDCSAQGIDCPNEAEFRAYFVLYQARTPAILETVQDWGREVWESDAVQTATNLVECLHNISEINGPLKPHSATDIALNAYGRFFTILKQRQVSYVMACFAEVHFNSVRKAILTTILAAYRKQRDQTMDWTLSAINAYLNFDSLDDAEEFIEAHGLHVTDGQGDSYLDFESGSDLIDPEKKIRQPFSQTIVEVKRGHQSIPHCIYHNSSASETTSDDQPSLFVEDAAPMQGFASQHFSQAIAQPFKQTLQQPTPPFSQGFPQLQAAVPPLPFSFGPNPITVPSKNAKRKGPFLDDDSSGEKQKTAPALFSGAQPSNGGFSGFGVNTSKGNTLSQTNSALSSPFTNGQSLVQGASAPKPSTFLPSTTVAPSLLPKADASNIFGVPQQSSTTASSALFPPKSSSSNIFGMPAQNSTLYQSTPAFSFQQAKTSETTQPSITNIPAHNSSSFTQSLGQTDTTAVAQPSPLFQVPSVPQAKLPDFDSHAQREATINSQPPKADTASTSQPAFSFGQKPMAPATPGISPSLFAKPIAQTSADQSAAFLFAPKAANGNTAEPIVKNVVNTKPAPAKQPAQSSKLATESAQGPSLPSDSPLSASMSTPITSEAAKYSWLKPRKELISAQSSNLLPTRVAPSRRTEDSAAINPIIPYKTEKKKVKADIPISLARFMFMDDDGIFAEFVKQEVERECRKAMKEHEMELQAEAQARCRKYDEQLAEADQFRKYSVAVKYFRKWRENAHKKWQLRRGMENRRLRQQMADERRAKALQAKEAQKTIVADFSKSVSDTRNKRRRMDDEERMLTSSGILNGLHNPGQAASRIVRGDMAPPRSTTPLGSPMPDRFARPASALGHSTASLQSFMDGEKLSQANATSNRLNQSTTSFGSSFRRSQSSSVVHRRSQSATSNNDIPLNVSQGGSRIHLLPKSYRASNSQSPRPSNVQTDYFRLKARGIYTLPNGVPVAKTAAVDFRSSGIIERARASMSASLESEGTPDRNLKRSFTSMGSSTSKRPKLGVETPAASISKLNFEEIKERARRVMQENALSKQREEDELKRRMQPPKSDRQRELEMEEMFRRSAKIRQTMAEDEEWMRQHRMSMSRSVSRARSESRPREVTAAPRLSASQLFDTPVKKAVPPPMRQEAIEIVDLSD